MLIRTITGLTIALAVAASASAQEVTKASLPGASNYSRVGATVGCAGSISPQTVPALKSEGYVSIINLRLEREFGANVPEERAAAEAAGLKYIHLPFNSSSPDPAVIEGFLKAVADPSNQPVFIHCASANRVGGVWMIKRIVQDGWPEDRAIAEAEAIGLSSSSLKEFALNYARSRKPQG